jgi:hypothetical protein
VRDFSQVDFAPFLFSSMNFSRRTSIFYDRMYGNWLLCNKKIISGFFPVVGADEWQLKKRL